MKIENLKTLKQVIKACRDGGVTNITIDGVALTLGDVPVITPRNTRSTPKVSDGLDSAIETPDSLTDEQLLFWSVSQEQ